jgi:hypothetical protein
VARGPVITRRSILVIVVAVIVATGFLAIIASQQARENARRKAASDATSTTSVTSPYDVTEVTGDLDLGLLEDATFVSILIPNAEGKPTSYMVDADSDAARKIIDAVRKAPEVKPGGDTTATTAAPGSGSTLTFMLPSRQTVTFAMNLDTGVLTRGGTSWHPRGDLRALVTAATSAPAN